MLAEDLAEREGEVRTRRRCFAKRKVRVPLTARCTEILQLLAKSVRSVSMYLPEGIARRPHLT